MPEQHEKRSADRNIVHCLRCYKPQDNLSVHLARVCMKNSTSEERVEELQKAKASSKEWIRNNRTWTYRQLCELLPHRRSRITLVKELLQRGFFILNLPQESEMVLEPEDDGDDAAATTNTSSRDPPTTPSSVRIKMKEAGLHDKFPAQAKFLVGFKEYLTKSLKVPNWQQEVDNVSRFLRYMQPTGSKLSLDFLSKSTETQDFLTALRRADMRSATILNYIKSIIRFLEYLTARRDLRKKIPQLRKNCRSYSDMLKTLRKTVSKTNEDKTCDSRRCAEGAPGIKDCQQILQVAKSDFLRIHGDLLKGKELSSTDKTLYRYYCEALLVFRHMQRPGAVEGLTDADWVERIAQGGRVVIGVRKEKSASIQIALTKEEEACLQLYYRQIRPKNIGLEKFCQGFFVSSSSDAVHSVSQDMNRLHEIYKLAPFKSQDVRRAVGKAAQKLTAQQQAAVNHYLAHSAGAVQQDRTPQDVVDAAELLDSLTGTSSDDTSFLAELSTAGSRSRKDFCAFVTKFPVSLEGQPPTKRQRVDSGFPEDRVFYDKWRATQYAQREEYLLSHFTHRKPSAAKVARLIAQEGWKANYPKPEEIERLWKPAPSGTVETNEVIIKCVSEQTWTGLAIKDFGAEEGLGVVATRPFSKGDIVCDYHGKVIPAAEGMAMIQGLHDRARNLFFFRAGQRDLCVDAHTVPCECHPDTDTVGRRIKRSSTRPNLEPFHCVLKVNGEDRDVILFTALQDISIDTQLKFYSGVVRRSFLGLELDWLDE